MERRPAVGSKCGVGILHVHVCQVKTITKNVPTIILTVHLRTWLIISRKLSLCGLFWTTLYIDLGHYISLGRFNSGYKPAGGIFWHVTPAPILLQKSPGFTSLVFIQHSRFY